MRAEPQWLKKLRAGDFSLFDQMVEAASWTRPVGRWFRLLLLVAGDVERNPGPVQRGEYLARGELDMLFRFATATSNDRRTYAKMSYCLWGLVQIGSWCFA